MATSEVLLKVGTQISFGDHAGDFVGGATKSSIEIGTPTDVQLALASVGDTAGRESAKVDLGATRARQFSVMASFEFALTPVTGELVELYWAPSPESVAANGNLMNIDGVDAAAVSGIGTLAELVAVSQPIGVFVCTNDATTNVQTGVIGIFSPAERYGILIVKNESGAAFHSDDVECNIVFNPIIDDIQAAA